MFTFHMPLILLVVFVNVLLFHGNRANLTKFLLGITFFRCKKTLFMRVLADVCEGPTVRYKSGGGKTEKTTDRETLIEVISGEARTV